MSEFLSLLSATDLQIYFSIDARKSKEKNGKNLKKFFSVTKRTFFVNANSFLFIICPKRANKNKLKD